MIYGSYILLAHSQAERKRERRQRRKQNKSSWGSCFGVGAWRRRRDVADGPMGFVVCFEEGGPREEIYKESTSTAKN